MSFVKNVLRTLAVGHAHPIVLVALIALAVAASPSFAQAQQLSLTWVDNSGGQASFIVQRATGSGGTYSQVAQVAAGVVSYTDTAVSFGTTYCYQVAAVNTAGTSAFSNSACGTPSGGFTISTTKAGTGSGTVVSSPAGINCGTTCSSSFPSTGAVTLTATPANGSTFSGWSGGSCGGTNPACIIVGNVSTTVTATFDIVVVNPVPTLTSLSPSSALLNGAALTLTVTGTGFVPASVIQWNGSARTTTFVSATQLTASIPASDLATAGPAPVTVVTPAPGGGTSSAVAFTVTAVNPAPTLASLSPSSALQNGVGFTLTVTGSGFVPASVVRWNGSNRTTTFVSASQLTASIPASDLTSTGAAPVTVLSPGPGGGTSSAGTFTVTAVNPVPALSSLSPTSTLQNGAAFTLTVTGSGFIPASAVQWNGSPRTTTFVSSSQLTASIAASDLGTAGSVPVSVVSPAPGGGTSSAVAFTVTAVNPAPALTSLSPSSALQNGAAFTLTVTGSGFVPVSTVQWNGSNQSTTFVSGTQLTATIPASDLITAGSPAVTVVTPAPGGGTSTATAFTVTAVNPAPALTSLSPSSALQGAGAFTLTVTGTSFIPTSVVQWNGSSRTTTFVSATQLTASISAGDLVAAGAPSVTVVTPAPGGGTSTAAVFSVTAVNPAPGLVSLSPGSAFQGGAAFTLTVTGNNFVPASVVRWNGSNRTTTFVSGGQLTASIPAGDLVTAGSIPVTVLTPAPGGGTSAAVAFTVTAVNPAPVLASLSPSSALQGSAAFTLTVTGSGFVPASVIQWNGNPRTTTFVSATQVTASIPASDLVTAGAAPVAVVNPAPGGGTSSAVAFTVTALNPVPSLTSLAPSSALQNGAAFTLTVAGSSFVPGSTVQWNGNSRSTTFVSSSQLTAIIPASDLVAAGLTPVTVVSPAPGGGSSTSVAFTVMAVSPAPTLTSLAPGSALQGDPGFVLSVTGSGFVPASVVQWNGSARATTFVSSGQLTASIPAGDLASTGSATITVRTPAPGGGTSSAVGFTVAAVNPAPALTSLSPASALQGGAAFTLTVTGSGFVPGSLVQWNGSSRATTFVSVNQLNATIPAGDLAVTGSALVSVVTPAPGGGTSSAATFTVTALNPVPTLTSLAPGSALQNGPAFSLTITGSGFIPASAVRWNGANRTTAFVSSTQLTASIPASDLAAAGSVAVTVVTPAPGGGTSSAVAFTVTAVNPVPTIGSLAPASALQGGAAFTLTVTGNGFVPASVVQWNGSSRPTTFASSTQLTASIAASDLASAGSTPVTVLTPAPGGGTSAAVAFTITAVNPAPALTSLAPASALQGGAAFTLTITGTGFVPVSTIQWNGSNRPTTFVSATQLTASIPANDLGTAGPAPVTVVSPAPGGGTSSAVAFTVTAMNPAPTLASLSPSSALQNGAAFTLTATGSGFVPASVVRWNGSNRTTTLVSSTQLTASIPASDLATAGPAPVTVLSPAPGGGTSSAVTFTVTAVNPAPVLTSLSPTSGLQNGAAFTLTVTGSGFISASTVQWNGSPRATTFVSTTQLTASIPASDLAAAGSVPVSVVTPAPGGGTSSALAFTVTAVNPTPVLTSLSPTSALQNGAAFTLTVTGSGFVPVSTVQWNGSNRSTTFVSATQLSASIPASDLATAGSPAVTVVSPAPGGGTSSAVAFTITAVNPMPAPAALTPSSAPQGSPDMTLTVTGSGFVPASSVQWNGSPRGTTFVSPTQLRANITTSDLVASGSAAVSVRTPAPGGGGSGTLAFAVVGAGLTVSGTTSPPGGPLTATLSNGPSAGAWLALARVGTPDSTYVQYSFVAAGVTARTWDVTMPAALGSYEFRLYILNTYTVIARSPVVTVANINPTPAITALSPAGMAAGSGPGFLTVTGTGFVSGTTATVGGQPHTVTGASATQLTVALLAADVATAGSVSVQVSNPASCVAGLCLSNVLNLAVTPPPPAPVLSNLSPTAAAAGGAPVTLTVTGSNFAGNSVVQVNGSARPTTFVSATQLTSTLSASDLAGTGTLSITVVTPAPGGGTSSALGFTITGPGLAVSSTMSPPSSPLTVTLTNGPTDGAWLALARVGTPNSTYVQYSFVAAGVTARTWGVTMPAALGAYEFRLYQLNTYTVIARSPVVTVANINPTPAISALGPAGMAAGGGAGTLTVIGTGFVSGTTVTVGGQSRSVTGVSATQLSVAVLAADVATVGSVPVQVSNPAACVAGLCASNVVSLVVTPPPPAPTLASLSPATAAAAGPAVTLTATGADFAGNSVIQVNGSPRATAFVSPTQLTATLPASDLGVAGTLSVTVTTPAPGGGTSSARPFVVTGPGLSVSASSSLPGGPLTATLTNGPSDGAWLALARVGTPDFAYVQYSFVAAGVTTRTWDVTMPAPLGAYEFRLYRLNTYSVIARSPIVAVTTASPAAPPALSVSTTSAAPNSSVTVTLTNGYGGSGDWLGLARVGAADTSFVQWVAVGTGITTRTWTVNMPATAGQYEFRLFPNSSFIRTATSSTVSVTGTSAGISTPDLQIGSSSGLLGTTAGTRLATISSGDTEWRALAAVDAVVARDSTSPPRELEAHIVNAHTRPAASTGFSSLALGVHLTSLDERGNRTAMYPPLAGGVRPAALVVLPTSHGWAAMPRLWAHVDSIRSWRSSPA